MARNFASSNLNPPTPPPLSLSCGGLNSLTPAWFCTSCCHFNGCFRLFVVFAIGLLRRFLYPILDRRLDRLGFVPNTFYTYNLSKYGLFQSLSQYGVFLKPWFTHVLWFKLKTSLEENECFCLKTVFYTKSCFTQKPSCAQTPCVPQKPSSHWACARTVCGLWWPAEHAEGGSIMALSSQAPQRHFRQVSAEHGARFPQNLRGPLKDVGKNPVF